MPYRKRKWRFDDFRWNYINYIYTTNCLTLASVYINFPISLYLPQAFLFCRHLYIVCKQMFIMPAWVWFRGFHSLGNSSILVVPLFHDGPVIVHCECPCIIRLVCTLPSQHHPECHALLGTHTLSILTCLQLALSDVPPLSFGALVLFTWAESCLGVSGCCLQPNVCTLTALSGDAAFLMWQASAEPAWCMQPDRCLHGPYT